MQGMSQQKKLSTIPSDPSASLRHNQPPKYLLLDSHHAPRVRNPLSHTNFYIEQELSLLNNLSMSSQLGIQLQSFLNTELPQKQESLPSQSDYQALEQEMLSK